MGRSRSSISSSTPLAGIKKVKGENFYRDAKSAARVKMLTGGKAVRDKDGRVVVPAAFQKGEAEVKPGRVMPDRRWFGNTRVISQAALEHFRESLSARRNDPYTVLLKRNKLPMSLLDTASSGLKRSHIIETEPFQDTFGPKAQRKRPKVEFSSFEALSLTASADVRPTEEVSEHNPQMPIIEGGRGKEDSSHGSDANQISIYAPVAEPIYAKGTSRRIYGELYKVLDSSDVIVHVLDARDPLGTLCRSILEWVRKDRPHKQVVYLINKIDLVPSWVTSRYIAYLSSQAPTLAFHASQTHSFGKGSLIHLLRQFSRLHSGRKQISVGFVGYPNVGKSSVINCLKAGKVCKTAPIPGETKVWQYVTLMRRIYLIDCPGIVPASIHDSPTSKVLKGVVRVENLSTPSEHIPALLSRVRPEYLEKTYELEQSLAHPSADPTPPTLAPQGPGTTHSAEVFLDALARKSGKLLKGGEPDRETVAKMVLNDWIRGRIPYFVRPPDITRTKPQDPVEGEATKSGLDEWDGISFEEEPPEHQPGTYTTEDEIQGLRNHVDQAGSPQYAADLQWEDLVGTLSVCPPPNDQIDSEGSPKLVPSKPPRMTTNKRKATNFFTTANVKNKQRIKASQTSSIRGRKH